MDIDHQKSLLLIHVRLAELDRLEKAVKKGNHPEYLKLIEEIEEKRSQRLKVGEAQYQYAMRNQTAIMEAARKSANDHFQLQKKGLRRRMIEHVQQKINALEQEYYSHNRQSSMSNVCFSLPYLILNILSLTY